MDSEDVYTKRLFGLEDYLISGSKLESCFESIIDTDRQAFLKSNLMGFGTVV